MPTLAIGFNVGPDVLQASHGVFSSESVASAFVLTKPAGGSPSILTTSLANATVGTAYSQTLSATGGSPPYAWSIVSATPNYGLWLYVTQAGVLIGTPQTTETETIIVQVTDATGLSSQATLSMTVNVTGSLAIITPSLPSAPLNGFFSYQLLAQGGTPPYVWSSSTASQPWVMTIDGWLLGVPVTSSTVNQTVTVTDAVNATATYSPSITISSAAIYLQGVDSTTQLLNIPPAVSGSPYTHQLFSYGGSGSGQTFSITSGSLPPGLSLASSGLISGTPTSSGNASLAIKVIDSASNTTTANALISVSSNTSVSRPAYNSVSANGPFVRSGKLYDRYGHPFNMRGADRVHFNSDSWASNMNGALSGINACREFYGFGLSSLGENQTVAQMVTQINTEYLANNIYPIISVSLVPVSFTGSISGTTLTVTAMGAVSTANSGIITLGAILQTPTGGYVASQLSGTSGGVGTYTVQFSQTVSLSTITAQITVSGQNDSNIVVGATNMLVYALANGLSAVQSSIAINIANEWGSYVPTYNTYANWQSRYITAVSALRGAGFTGPIVIDLLADNTSSYSASQDIVCISGGYAASILASDPLQNIIFDLHLYGLTPASCLTLCATIQSFMQSGIACAAFEFGPPGLNNTTCATGQIITALEAYGIPWNYWAWDDGTGSWNTWFNMTAPPGGLYSGGEYVPSTPAMYSANGLTVGLHPRYGLVALASPIPQA